MHVKKGLYKVNGFILQSLNLSIHKSTSTPHKITHRKRNQCVTSPVSMLAMQAVLVATLAMNWDGGEIFPEMGNTFLKGCKQHDVLVMDERHNDGPQELVTVSIRIQNDIQLNIQHATGLADIPAVSMMMESATSVVLGLVT